MDDPFSASLTRASFVFAADVLDCFRSIVISNVYAILHDPSVYSNPGEFNPDRYLPASEGGLGEPLPVGNFGFGRR
jgi:hypothetical protein